MTSNVPKDISLVLVKPDGVQRSLVGNMINRFEQKGLKIIALKMLVPAESQCQEHYNKDDIWFLEKGQGIVSDLQKENITIEKGSITVNGVSLTVVNSIHNRFSVAIIPYTYENTSFNELKVGKIVNLEFDLIGKYISKLYLKR